MTPSPARAPSIPDYNIQDGFAYNASIRCGLPYDFRGLALQRMRALRLSTHKPYIHCTRTFQVAPYSNVQTQIRMLAGTYLWGYYLWNNTSPGYSGEVAPHTLYVKVTDNATGQGPFGDWISEQDLFSLVPDFSYAWNDGGFIQYPAFLAEPYVVTDPGLFTIEFSNNGNNGDAGATHQVQMQFFACVPCDRPQGGVDLEDCI